MWIRKSDEQIGRDRRRLWLSFRGPLLLFPLMFVATIARSIQERRTDAPPRPDTWQENLSFSAMFAAICALGLYVLQLVLRRRIEPFGNNGKVVICNRCHRVTQPSHERGCQCGGEFDDFENWDWIDD
jgi:hypothetical protein